MRDVLEDIARWQAAGERIALATVVAVAGSAPRGVGATLAASESGEISGSVSNGCVEPAVIEEALRTLRTGRPKLLTFGITEAQNVEQIGLSCGGEIRVFVERLGAIEPLARALRAEEPIAQATVVSVTHPDAQTGTPPLGGRLLAPARGAVQGTLGDAALDAKVTDEARALLRSGHSTLREYTVAPGTVVEVFFAVYPPAPTLIIVGAGHIAIPLMRLAKIVGYRVVVVDPREAFATRERLPEADEILLEWPDEALARLPLSSATAVAVLTHDDKFDVPALRVALGSEAGYIGVIGSRGTRAERDRRLREEGVDEEQLTRIHGPIGLNLGARTPEEIALAILAEIIATRHGRSLGATSARPDAAVGRAV